ncbi:thiamine pyrophosphokinase [Hysterangium stoloniferum]|nr:thiamine pyrophosphokinase [Hysterangium stoloniferum]
MTTSEIKHWLLPFLSEADANPLETALIILNQPFSEHLLRQLWTSSSWHACADGGSNRLYDVLQDEQRRSEFLPNLIKGDLDSIREDVREYYSGKDVAIVQDPDQFSTDLQKCLSSLSELEAAEDVQVYSVVLLGGLSGRLDQTMHTLSVLHKFRASRPRMFAVTDEGVAWVLDAGEHIVKVDLQVLGPTCGLLPVGIDETILSTRGLEWNLDNTPSSFEGLISTSNHVVASEVWIKTTKPICWCIEVRKKNPS